MVFFKIKIIQIKLQYFRRANLGLVVSDYQKNLHQTLAQFFVISPRKLITFFNQLNFSTLYFEWIKVRVYFNGQSYCLEKSGWNG
jgi:hypothetical protein